MEASTCGTQIVAFEEVNLLKEHTHTQCTSQGRKLMKPSVSICSSTLEMVQICSNDLCISHLKIINLYLVTLMYLCGIRPRAIEMG